MFSALQNYIYYACHVHFFVPLNEEITWVFQAHMVVKICVFLRMKYGICSLAILEHLNKHLESDVISQRKKDNIALMLGRMEGELEEVRAA